MFEKDPHVERYVEETEDWPVAAREFMDGVCAGLDFPYVSVNVAKTIYNDGWLNRDFWDDVFHGEYQDTTDYRPDDYFPINDTVSQIKAERERRGHDKEENKVFQAAGVFTGMAGPVVGSMFVGPAAYAPWAATTAYEILGDTDFDWRDARTGLDG